nr:hypothetical protein [Tanacetum cinerariifolium]
NLTDEIINLWNLHALSCILLKSVFAVKDKPEKDKIESKPDKNEKRGEAEKSQKQLQSRKKEKQKKMQVEGPKMQNSTSFINERRKERAEFAISSKYKEKGQLCLLLEVVMHKDDS